MKQNWYVAKSENIHNQGLVADEDTGENIAVIYKAENAPVIAASPELLDILEEIADTISFDPRLYNLIGKDRYHRARAIIKKARGE